MTTTRDPAPTAGLTLLAAAVPAHERTSRARVPLTPVKGLIGRALNFYSQRRYGQVLDNLLAMNHNRKVLLTDAVFELSLARWNKLDEQLKQLAVMAASVDIGCSWCMDFGYFEAHSAGLDMAKIEAVPQWRSSSVFTPTERRVLEYTEAMTATPPTVTDDMTEALRQDLGDDGLVELTMMVCVENLRSRFNAALGLQSQGFAESCRVPVRVSPADQT
ncbi:MAG: carboxymuconolactone decarboxylase family protein [Nakamurella sp.]